RRLVGPSPEDRDFSVRLLRAVATSAFFDALYLIIAGPEVVDFARRRPATPGGPAGFATSPREAAALALLLLVAIPALAAATPFVRFLPPTRGWLRRVLDYPNQSIPSAWDYAAPLRADCFVVIY